MGSEVEPAAVAAQAREHLAAGADHVALLPPIGIEFASGIKQLENLAPVLTEPG